MSLHIESTENALAELKKQRTKTLTAAISVSFLGTPSWASSSTSIADKILLRKKSP